MSTLESVDWGGPARHLLESTRSLEAGKTAAMHIRHTARTTVSREDLKSGSKVFDHRALVSTSTGIQAAVDFGSLLPRDRKYTLHHTRVDRARETAEGISRGVIESGGEASVAGMIPYAVSDNPEAWNRWLQSQKWFPQEGAYDLTRLWIAGLVPKTIFKPSWEFAREYAKITMGNLWGSPSDAFHIYVSHDNYIASLIFHWFGVPPYGDGVRFLEGFLMQVCDGGLSVWLRDRHEVYDFPYWWPESA